jgi:YD repeat-containing protein
MKSFFRLSFFALLAAAAVVLADTASFTYDSAGRLTGMSRDATNLTTFQYDVSGNLTRAARFVVADSDGDGMADSFELAYFGNLTRDGLNDFDSDGLDDLAEYFAGTVPTNSASVLRMNRFITNTVVQTTVSWLSVTGKTYRVQFKPGLSEIGWNDVPGDVTAVGTNTIKTDTTTLGDPERYYRVQVVQ